MSRKGTLLLAGILLAATFLLFDCSELDLWAQDLFYSFHRHEWLVPKNSKLPRILFYHGPKVLLIAFGAWLLLSLVIPHRSKARRLLSRRAPRDLIYLMICLGLFPAFIGAIKKVSGLHCPSELSRYGGEHVYRKLFAARPASPHEPGHCFPAGHASGGFALLGLWFVAQTDRTKKAALGLGLSAGWLMGTYQMLNGSHFLSHTWVTMLLAWIFTLFFAILFRLPTHGRNSDSEQSRSWWDGERSGTEK